MTFHLRLVYQFIMRNGEILQYTVKDGILIGSVSCIDYYDEDSSISEIQSKDSYESGTLTVNGKSTMKVV